MHSARARASRAEQPVEDTSGQPVIPQDFAVKPGKRSVLKALLLDEKRDELLAQIKATAARVCGCELDDIRVQVPSKRASSAAGQKRKTGYLLIDGRASDALQSDRECLVTVFFARSRGDREVLVPYIVAHEHPENWGVAIRVAVYRNFRAKHGIDPLEVIKPGIRGAMEKLDTVVKHHKASILGTTAGTVLLGLLLWKGPKVIDDMSEHFKKVEELRVAKELLARSEILTKLERQAKAFEDKTLTKAEITQILTRDDLDRFLEVLRFGTPEDKMRGLKLLDKIGAPMLVVYDRGRLGGPAQLHETVIGIIREEKDGEVRQAAANSLHMLSELKAAKAEKPSTTLP